jgi:UDP-N-acetylglucosamine--N-acetylmuramyl-(pentapeptide) pyrophosphoryl-undecaprenol N-acetylglucosamine transferase
MRKHRFIISGGGSGGHIFPAIAIADALVSRESGAGILFVGAEGKMEMEKVPQAGYPIKGLKVSGLQRSLTWKNLLFPVRLFISLGQAYRIIRDFTPDVVIGVGGYASAPTVAMASIMGIPTLIQEQNSYAGLTNRWLARKVKKICVAYDGMERFFEKDKIVLTGNPIRKELLQIPDRRMACDYFGLSPDKKTILLFGGSLGARTLNRAMEENGGLIRQHPEIQFIWQTGSYDGERFIRSETAGLSNVHATVFIDRMDLAYRCADLVICRAGALTIAELCALGKASILVPSPNVTEDHQTANARALELNNAAEMIADKDAPGILIMRALELIHDQDRLKKLEENSLRLGRPEATESIVNEILKLIDNHL